MVPGSRSWTSLAEQGQTPEHLVWFQSWRPVELSVLAQLEQRLGGGCTVERVTLELEPLGGGALPARTLRRLVPEVLRARQRSAGRARRSSWASGASPPRPRGLAALLPREQAGAAGDQRSFPDRAATRLLGPLAKEVWHAVEA